jgi:glutathione synthase/RimK-type ligase-like ATP-grasp enzyme
MNFADFNEDWINRLSACRGKVRERNANGKVRAFLDSYDGHAFHALPIPVVFPREDYDALVDAGRTLLSAQTKIIRHLCDTLGREGVLKLFRVPDGMVPLIDWDELIRGERIVSRFDIVPAEDGYYFCEMNTDSSVGCAEMFDCLQVYADALDWSLADGFHSPNMDKAQLVSKLVTQKGLDRILIFGLHMYEDSGFPSLEMERIYFRAAMPDIAIDIVDEFTYPEALLAPERGAKTLVYRIGVFEDMNCQDLYERIVASGATVVNTFESAIRMDKAWFSLFHDAGYHPVLDSHEIATIHRYVPYTFHLAGRELESVLAAKDEYVFKLNHSYGGTGVLLGAEHTVAALRADLLARGIDNWIVQRLIPFRGIDMPNNDSFEPATHNLVAALYLIDGEASGMMIRASCSSKVVNVSQKTAKMVWAVPVNSEDRSRLLDELEQG